MNTDELKCDNGAPHIFFITNSGQGVILQGCCNSWTCQRCGIIRANEEYYKLTYGAMCLEEDDEKLYFVTLTCRGREISLKDAEENYYRWTSKLLNSTRMKCRRAGKTWQYSQVTERQKRGHPHSHLIMTYVPGDCVSETIGGKTRIRSKWFERACKRAGLGNQYDITEIRNARAVAIYISKYLFKEAISTTWPRGWRRIRYSRGWPREDKSEEKPEIAFPILTNMEWTRVRNSGVKISTASNQVAHEARIRGIEVKVSSHRSNRLETDI